MLSTTPAPTSLSPELVTCPVLRRPDRPTSVPAPRGQRQVALKRAIDVAVALLLLAVLLPVLLVVAVAVKVSSPGPVLFAQPRIGQDGRRFRLLKFRSMRVAPAAASVLAAGCAPGGVEGGDRRTRVGKLLRRTSLDELPQLLNVLLGQMSLVGPRPERPEFVQLFSDEVPGYLDRHRVPVGMTGLAQVSGLRGGTSIARRADIDNDYIDRWSLLLDLKVLLRTIPAACQGA